MASTVETLEHEHSPVWHQFEDFEQQTETYLVGMWSFLAQEVMFFGALFLAYTLYRTRYPGVFELAHLSLDWKLGALNTSVLLFSSFTMVLAVHYAQLKDVKNVILNLSITIACAFVFLGVKTIEYSEKFKHHLFPGPNFSTAVFSMPAELHQLPAAGVNPASINPNAAQIFFSLYFVMTGLHALHIIIGIIVLGAILYCWKVGNKLVTEDYVPTEMVGLYWHFVDIVWIFLFPLYYLIPK
jgi:cytochrome c oxidase subunit III